MPIGVVISKGNNRIKLMNKELARAVLPEPVAAETENVTEENLQHRTSVTAFSPQNFDVLSSIAKPGGITLKDALAGEQVEGGSGGHVRRMVRADKVFEVKTKYISISTTQSCKIAVVKDQTVYEHLIKEETLERYQRMLLSSITHEIRNPLNVIEGNLAMIQETEEREQQEKLTAKIKSAAQQIDFIVTGACDLLLSESKTLIVHPCDFHLEGAVDEVMAMVRSSAEAKGLKLEATYGKEMPKTLMTDAKKYKLILFHLLANAVKYTSKGSVLVDAGYSRETGTLTTSVADTGAGIRVEDIPGLFQLYTNVKKANSYNPQGMGLGLPLCKKLSRILGGDIVATSAPGKGSRFSFTIQNFEDQRLPGPAEMRLAGPRGDEMREVKFFMPATLTAVECASERQMLLRNCGCPNVLVVDDDANNRIVLRNFLQSFKVKVEEAENGFEALQCVKRRLGCDCCKRFMLILMDINMPVMDGTEATCKLVSY
ncbi:MAG: ATP-binding protein [Candidatus Pacebacteria bacterium]|nr:ATP-binding protein [Candidatus Paceibacterota bacterium]